MNPEQEPTLSEEEIYQYSKELDELFESLLFLLLPSGEEE
jgi:hypothetical protein